MSERYTKLFALSENFYNENAPLLIAAGALLKDNETGRVLAQVKLKNISEKTIKAVKISVRAFDISGTELEGVAEYQYLDLSVGRDAEFGQKNAIALPDKVTRSFSCECKSVVFSDGTSWEAKGAEWKPLIQPETLQKRLGGLSAQYKRGTVKQAQFVVTDDRDLWICTCGAINRQSEAKCHACHSEKTALLAALDMEALKNHNAEHNRAEAERKEKEAAEAKKKRAKTKKISIISAACAIVIIAAIVVITQVLVPSSKYNSAVALMNEGKYQEAIASFKELDEYKDSITLLEKCEILLEEQELQAEKEATYTEGLTALEDGDYDTAYALFFELEDYKDSAQQAKESIYQMAISLIDNLTYDVNDLSTIQNYYEKTETIKDYKDVKEILERFHKVLISAGEQYYIYDANDLILYDGQYYYTYDTEGRISSKTTTNGTIYTVTYDERGLLTSEKSSRGTYLYSYNDNKQLIKKTYSSEYSDIVTTYKYNEKGELIEEVQLDGLYGDDKTTYTYDEQGRIIAERSVLVYGEQQINPGYENPYYDKTYVYNEDGELIQTITDIYSHNGGETTHEIIDYTYGWIIK